MEILFLFLVLASISSTEAASLSGSSQYAVIGKRFNLTCDGQKGTRHVDFFRLNNSTSKLVQRIYDFGNICFMNGGPCAPNVCWCKNSNFMVSILPKRKDEATWICTRYGLEGESDNSTSYALRIADGPGTSTNISPPQTSYTREEGDLLPDITCAADCEPECSFDWTKPDNTNINSSVLSLQRLDRSERGTYTCVARNIAGVSTTNVNIEINYGPGSSISVYPPDTAYTLIEGDTLATISCGADCNPDCTYIWTRPDNTNLTTSQNLSLQRMDRSEQGTYMCIARNIVGESTINISIDVYFRAEAPTITKMPIRTRYYEGSSLNLTCAAGGNPPVIYLWRFNGSSLSINPKLQLTNIKTDQSGEYVCEVMNSFDGNIYRQSRAVSITIDPIEIKPLNTNVVIRLRENKLTLTCYAEGNPVYMWLLDGVLVSTLSEFEVASTDQSGQYVCIATIVSNGERHEGNKSVTIAIESPQPRADNLYITGIVLVCLSVTLFLLTIGLGIFITRNDRLPFFKKKHGESAPQNSAQVTPRHTEEGESQYQPLDTSAVAGPSVYDVLARPPNATVSRDIPEERAYEDLQERSNHVLYDELHV